MKVPESKDVARESVEPLEGTGREGYFKYTTPVAGTKWQGSTRTAGVRKAEES